MNQRRFSLSSFIVAASLALAPVQTAAQNLFAPVIRVNEDAITLFELQQRQLFMELLRIPGDPVKMARETLIDDRLRQQAINQVGISVAPEDVQAGIDEFAARAELSSEEFIQALEQGGVSYETLRDFIKIQLAWRDYVGANFLSRARPTDAEISRAMGQAGGGGGLRVLLSEIILPLSPQNFEQVDELAQQISELKGFDAFESAARQYSAAASSQEGGRMSWLPLSQLPPALQPVILGLSPGEITAPIPLPQAVALFQMRSIQETGGGSPRYASIEYAVLQVSANSPEQALAKATEIKNRTDTCDDLYGAAKGLPPEILARENKKPGEIPRDVALELARLDPNEISVNMSANGGQTRMLVMLCDRTADLGDGASREDVANALTQQRLSTFADSYLEQLRADAIIVEE
ncbi:peptidylprolyl isomerase [Primorskyibacter sp. S87]|uniref:peptidylprolyl isomerase n=1 Tax=Primorskyibacter sp. S87 TaxID=3415126 RepID=UPI003C7ABA28